MPEQIQRIIDRIREWWGKFSIKQRAMMISIVAVVIIALSILGYVVSRPTMVTLITCTDTDQSAKVKDLLDGEDITYKLSDDALTFSINKEDQAAAEILLGTNDIPSDGYSIDDVLNGSFTTTEADKEKKYQVYLEDKFSKQLSTIKNVDSAEVTLSIPTDDGTLVEKKEESYANVILDLNDTMSSDQASGIAKYIATGLGNKTTENITILDSDGNVLFSGGDEVSSAGIASTNLSVQQEAESAEEKKIKKIFSSSNNSALFDNVEIGVNLSMNFDSKNTVDYHYYVDDGMTQGLLDSSSESNSESTSGNGGTPGTDSNNDTTYVTENDNNSSNTTSDVTKDYLPSETITTTDGQVGAVSYDDSSISIIAYNYVIYNEDELKAAGKLNKMTFDEFVTKNSGQVKTKVDQDLYTAVSNATHIPTANITILTYDVPMFQYSENTRDWTDYLEIVLAVLIFAMLGFVVFRTLRRDEEEPVEEEVSVETLLNNQPDENLENIGFTEKSEARILIEKFVDENPDAVAALLRNWLNDDWS